ncbi:unnamed protein product [Rotaria socialis]|uniref:Uncharacterized protein n=1 Tax=Rotaria socialis TaxID=392032 RepID=A0A820UUF8_9BILA|nr:unnamed protein product [Rotaria socialis]CAF4490483.1 unnamed protein product [Rotaria socialis]CAF4589031.1 unnamed protein product [Rotaria socialis]CAF4656173.1 unnamed protein product [Rotaria socialis]CAF4849559.1 unnamed protein product [Rotaria socialis]
MFRWSMLPVNILRGGFLCTQQSVENGCCVSSVELDVRLSNGAGRLKYNNEENFDWPPANHQFLGLDTNTPVIATCDHASYRMKKKLYMGPLLERLQACINQRGINIMIY